MLVRTRKLVAIDGVHLHRVYRGVERSPRKSEIVSITCFTVCIYSTHDTCANVYRSRLHCGLMKQFIDNPPNKLALPALALILADIVRDIF